MGYCYSQTLFVAILALFVHNLCPICILKLSFKNLEGTLCHIAHNLLPASFYKKSKALAYHTVCRAFIKSVEKASAV